MKKRRIVLKLSGQALAGENKVGISHTKVNEIAAEIKALYDLSDIELDRRRRRQHLARRDVYDSGMDRSSADYMGMLATILNALSPCRTLEKLGLNTRAMTSLHIPGSGRAVYPQKALSSFQGTDRHLRRR